jgi:hypothetical protein
MSSAEAKHICTMVDEDYLCFGLALHESVREHAPDWTIHVVCLDDASESVLRDLALEGLVPIPFEELEEAEPGLTVARAVRPRHDFVMTSKPFALRRVFAGSRPPAAVTWLDADAMCFAPIDPLLDELADGSVLLAPQGVPAAFRWVEERTGAFMGGLLTFRNNESGRNALDWWAARCLFGGCPRAPDQHRFGDQKYLQDLPDLFAGVRVTPKPGLWLAPSNIERHEISTGSAGPLVDGNPLVLYQYTGFRVLDNYGYETSFPPWRIGARERELIYEPFLARVQRARRRVQNVAPDFDAGFMPPRTLVERATAAGSRTKGALLRARHRLRSGSLSSTGRSHAS